MVARDGHHHRTHAKPFATCATLLRNPSVFIGELTLQETGYVSLIRGNSTF